MSTDIHPRLNEILQSNVGNKLTPELAAGVVGTLQQLMNSIAQEAFMAGQAAEREGIEVQDPAVVTDVDVKVA